MAAYYFGLLADVQLSAHAPQYRAVQPERRVVHRMADVRGRVAGDPLIPYYTRPGFNGAATLHYSF